MVGTRQKSAIELIAQTSAIDFLDYMRLARDHWWTDSAQDWVFRGVSNAAYNLLPTALRPITDEPKTQLKEERRKLLDREKSKDPSKPEFEYWHLAMREGVKSFIEEAMQFGHRFPHGTTIVLHDDPQFSIAQHHGIPTFLLDWTFNPLVSAFFCCEGWCEKNKPDVAIWCLNDSLRQKTAPGYMAENCRETDLEKDCFAAFGCQLIVPQRGISEYLLAQSGVFTWIEGKYENGIWLGADQILEKHEFDEPFLRKITLPGAEVPALKKLLDREGMSLARLMPTLDNIARTARSRW